MTVILNGKASNTKPEEVIVINGKRTIELPPIINGFVPTDITINGYDRPPVLPGCILYLPFWHSKLSRQTPIYSMDKYGHAGTVVGALWRPDGRYHDGSDDNVNFGNPAVFSGLTEVTWEAWVYPQDLVMVKAYHGIISKCATFKGGLHINYVANAVKGFAVSADDGSVVSTDSLADSWYHVIGLASTTSLELIVDRTSKGTATGTYTPVTDAVNLLVGRTNDAGRFSRVIIGEIRVFNRILSEAEYTYLDYATRWRYQ